MTKTKTVGKTTKKKTCEKLRLIKNACEKYELKYTLEKDFKVYKAYSNGTICIHFSKHGDLKKVDCEMKDINGNPIVATNSYATMNYGDNQKLFSEAWYYARKLIEIGNKGE